MKRILTWHPTGKPGFYIPKKDYDVVRDFILSSLVTNQMSLIDLIALGEQQLAGQVKGKLAWEILIVKLDLESRGIIVSSLKINPFRAKYLKLSRQAAREIVLNGRSIINRQSVK